MAFELGLSPGGRLIAFEREDEHAPEIDAWPRRAVEALRRGPGAGLFALAATRPAAPLPPSFEFWRELACRYLTELCRTPGDDRTLEPIAPPGHAELAALLLAAPPMRGGEYLNEGRLRALWGELDRWLRERLAESGEDLASWLAAHAPLWHRVGRVCLHLAENKRDHDYPFAFLATYAPRLSAHGRVQYQPLGRALEEYAGEKNRKTLIKLLSPVHRASERSALVRELVDSGDIFHPLAWTPAEAHRFLKEVPLLEQSGLLVRVPDWWHKRPRPRVRVTIGDAAAGRFAADALLDFEVGLALGDERLTKAEWRRLLAADDGLVELKGRWVEVDRERLAEALDHWRRIEREAKKGGISFVEGMRLLAGAPADLDADAVTDGAREWSAVEAGRWLAGVLAELKRDGREPRRAESPGLRGTLRPYQAQGRDWLWLLANLGLGACLADDMGLGKTLQVLALLVALKASRRGRAKPSLLVLPASLLGNWRTEIERFAPDLEVLFAHPSELGAGGLERLAGDAERALAGVDLVVTTYGLCVRQSWLAERAWRLVILDEAQAIKNPAARQTKAVKRLRAEARVALTGTPVENRLSDLWSLFDFLCPGLLGSASRFKAFVKAIERRERDRYAPLRRLVAPYILRRLKTDRRIIDDLPEKTEMKAFCGLTKAQAALYARTVEALARTLREVEGIERRGAVLATLMRLKQICNHPSQLLGDGGYEPPASGKFARLAELCEEIAARQERALVFTQFRELTAPLAAFLGRVFAREGLILDGTTAVRRRKAVVDAFQHDEGPPFLVLSLKAGGVGLNLTAASHVIHFDRWWNPAVENQATDRAFRIGQRRNVLVHKFVCRGTVEERIDEAIDDKSRLAEDILGAGGEVRLTELDDQALLEVVRLDVERASG